MLLGFVGQSGLIRPSIEVVRFTITPNFNHALHLPVAFFPLVLDLFKSFRLLLATCVVGPCVKQEQAKVGRVAVWVHAQRLGKLLRCFRKLAFGCADLAKFRESVWLLGTQGD